MQRLVRVLLSCALVTALSGSAFVSTGSAAAPAKSKAHRASLASQPVNSKPKHSAGPLAAPANPSMLAIVASDDDVPGVTLPMSPVNDSLDEYSDYDDVFAVDLTAGQSISLSLTGAEGTDFDLYLYPPGTGSVSTSPEVAYATTESYPETINFNVQTTGTYYIDAYAYAGSGAYTLTYTINDTFIGDDDVPGTSILASPITDTLNEDTDYDDVYAITLFKGQVLSASLTAGDYTDFDLYVYAPGTASVSTSPELVKAANTWYPEQVDFVAPVSGTYYLDAYSDTGSGAYTLTYSVSAGSSTVSLSSATACVWPASMNFWARALEFGRPLLGQYVILQRRPLGSTTYTSVKTGFTAATGYAGLAYAPAGSADYRALIMQGGMIKSSNTRRVTLTPYLTIAGPSSVAKGKTFSIYGFLGPRHPYAGHSVKINCYLNGTYRKSVLTTNYNYTSAAGKAMTKYIGKLALTSRGTWTLKAVVTGDNTHTARTVSKTVKIY